MKNQDYYNQNAYNIRCEWGLEGLAVLAPVSDVIIIVDVLSFTTCVDVAAARGALVYPYRGSQSEAAGYARELSAHLAAGLSEAQPGYALSPSTLLEIPAGTRLVLPSLNGSRLSLETGSVPTLAGCLRNARTVAQRARHLGRRISVIPAGERWQGGLLRPALEDLLGAGAILDYLEGSHSPEAQAACAVFNQMRERLPEVLQACSSGLELAGAGRQTDIQLSAMLNASDCAPQLLDGAFQYTGLTA